nr:MAG TPA: hypothetical protein [Caudoviricetes sp.]
MDTYGSLKLALLRWFRKIRCPPFSCHALTRLPGPVCHQIRRLSSCPPLDER